MRPNILFIVADDLNAWIGALGRHPQARTPNIDAMARRGALFVNAYCSAPYCNASRMGFFTGRLPSTLSLYHNEDYWGRAERPPTFVERLRAHGYATYGAGKVFHGVYDYALAGRNGLDAAPWCEKENRDHLWDLYLPVGKEPLPLSRPLNRLFDFADFESVPEMYRHFDWGPVSYADEVNLPDTNVAQWICNLFKGQLPEPFFLAAGFYKPHLPWYAPQRFFDMHPTESVVLPLVRDDDLDDVPQIARDWALSPRDHELITSRGVWKEAVRGYLACISYLDALVGEIMKALDASRYGRNTAVVLCGDNGFHLGEKLHWRKFALWEEATRVPLIYVPSGGAQPIRILEPVSLIDIAPTLLDLAGAPADTSTDGCNLRPLLTAEGRPIRPRNVISTWGAGNHSIRTQRWRFTTYQNGGEELYDHAADPHEWTNLASLPEFAGVCKDLAMLTLSQTKVHQSSPKEGQSL